MLHTIHYTKFEFDIIRNYNTHSLKFIKIYLNINN